MRFNLRTEALTRASARRPRLTIALWVVGLVVALGLVATLLGSALTTDAGFTNDPESIKGAKILDNRGFEDVAKGGGAEIVIVQSKELTVDDPRYRAFVEGLYADLVALGDDVFESSMNAYNAGLAGAALVSQDRHTTIMPFTRAEHFSSGEDIDRVLEITARADRNQDFDVVVTGDETFDRDFVEISKEDLEVELLIGIPAAIVILVLVFGALAASAIPIIVAVVTIVLALGVTALIGQIWTFSFFVTNMIAMMGLAVGVDYSLFIVSRFREERARGIEKADAIAIVASTASRAVFFSGVTVVLALVGMVIVPLTIMRSLGGGAIIVVIVSIVASLTLLPAILSLMGDKVNSLRIPLPVRSTARAGDRGGFWDWVSQGVMRRPVASLLVVVAILVAAAVPAFDLKTGQNGISTFPDDTQSKQGFTILDEEFSFGLATSPAAVVVDGDVESPAVLEGIERLKRGISADGSFGVVTTRFNEAGDLALVQAQVDGDPTSDEVVAAVRRLRGEIVPAAFAGVDTEVYVSGIVAFNIDYFDVSSDYIPVVFAFVLALSFVLLTIVFRSLVVPIKAIIMNLLSVGAAYGLMVLVFQKGVAADLLGFRQVEVIDAWIPLFLFSVLFGLSMDYHVFLLSRIRESYDKTLDNAGSVAYGLRSTAGLITGAALIMVAIFSGFAAGQLVMFQQVGFGLAVAIFLDATIVRSVLVPAAMKLLGRQNWYLPTVLDWLPEIRVEGQKEEAVPAS